MLAARAGAFRTEQRSQRRTQSRRLMVGSSLAHGIFIRCAGGRGLIFGCSIYLIGLGPRKSAIAMVLTVKHGMCWAQIRAVWRNKSRLVHNLELLFCKVSDACTARQSTRRGTWLSRTLKTAARVCFCKKSAMSKYFTPPVPGFDVPRVKATFLDIYGHRNWFKAFARCLL